MNSNLSFLLVLVILLLLGKLKPSTGVVREQLLNSFQLLNAQSHRGLLVENTVLPLLSDSGATANASQMSTQRVC